MANPQTENGYTRIANELMEALTRTRIAGEARQVFDCILRKTYGYHKTEDAISLSQFCLATNLKKPNVVRSISKLIAVNLIIKKDNDKENLYSINKNFDTWKPLSKKITLSKRLKTVIKKDNETVIKKDTYKIYKDTKDNKDTKDIYSLAVEIISDLNSKTGKHYLATTEETQKLIKTLLKRGFTKEHFFKVHETMALKWGRDPEMERFLRPSTLYNPRKFEGYYNARVSLSDRGLVSANTERGLSAVQSWLEKEEAKDAQQK